MDMMTLAMAKPKKIDLTKYVVEVSGQTATFNDAILSMLYNGGGSVKVTEDGSFWRSLSKDRPMRFVLDLGAIGMKLEFNVGSVMMNEGEIFCIDTICVLKMQGTLVRVTMIFGTGVTGSTDIHVAVEPLTIPEA